MRSQAAARQRIIVTGGVQGVGFRPFVYRLALEFGLAGFVKNSPEGVVIEIEGDLQSVRGFERDLPRRLPPLASIVSLTSQELAPLQASGFSIEQSSQGQGHSVLISPDIATCADCLGEVRDAADRRHLYPFTNCTNCGPRLSITRSIPYDRATTSMACFPMCEPCRAEYSDPLSRRFHAQPNACADCGPKVWLTDASGQEIARQDQAIELAAKFLAEGKIGALKGLGGFHLACAATRESSVAELRKRKRRPAKSLAIMVADLNTASQLAEIGEAGRELLAGRVRPIVLAEKKPKAGLAGNLAPDTGKLGLMLPYAPLQHVLLWRYAASLPPGEVAALVMTSGNLSGEPIALGNREALQSLARFADFFLLHDRDILIRVDDSVLGLCESGGIEEEVFFRRARGYAPSPVFLPFSGPCVLGAGPELKATVCLNKGDQAFVSQHLGDLENLKTYAFFEQTIEHYKQILRVSPQAVVADLHPNYLSTRYALESSGLPVFRLQHHFAHIHAVLAENKFQGRAVGLALDGSGYGEDGSIWGGEALLVDNRELVQQRLAHFKNVALPGGEAAVKNPWRMAVSYMHALGEGDVSGLDFLQGRETESAIVRAMLEKNLNCPRTSSLGRLFDALAGLTGICASLEYEGQAAIRLEAAQDLSEMKYYHLRIIENDGAWILDGPDFFAQALGDARHAVEPGRISRRFHLGLVKGLASLCHKLCASQNTKYAALSGGVMQNLTLASLLPQELKNYGLIPITHRLLPPGDACISLGQTAFGLLCLR